MLKRLNDLLAGVPMTIVGGVFLVASLILMLTKTGVSISSSYSGN